MLHEWVVTSKDSGNKLVTFLTLQLASQYSAKSLKRAIENNLCQVNGRTERFASTIVGTGDQISLVLENSLPTANPLRFDLKRLLFEDSNLLIYNKPSGINCDEEGMWPIIKAYCPVAEPMHRLDRETTGALLFSKTPMSAQHLLMQFKKTQVKKCYRAIVDGLVAGQEGMIDNFLGKQKIYAGQTRWGAVKTGGLHAVTHWKRLKMGKKATLLHCFPETGRTHQIRVHMAEMGHPIIGDYQYVNQFVCPYRATHYLLHAEQLTFTHPETGQVLCVKAPLGEDFLAAQNQLFGVYS